jgi:hypothetical protein
MVVDLVEECEWAMIRNIHFNNVLRVLEVANKVTWGQCYNFRRFSAKQIGVFLKSQWCIPGNNSLSCPSRVQFISQCLCFVWSNSNKVSPNEGRSNKTVAPHWRQKSRQKGGTVDFPWHKWDDDTGGVGQKSDWLSEADQLLIGSHGLADRQDYCSEIHELGYILP